LNSQRDLASRRVKKIHLLARTQRDQSGAKTAVHDANHRNNFPAQND
jgi:hypothetical protein